jgi:hypothetical protein
MSTTYQKHDRQISTAQECVTKLSNKCPTSVQKVSKKCPASVPKVSQMCQKSLSKVCLQFADAYVGCFLHLIIPELEALSPLPTLSEDSDTGKNRHQPAGRDVLVLTAKPQKAGKAKTAEEETQHQHTQTQTRPDTKKEERNKSSLKLSCASSSTS